MAAVDHACAHAHTRPPARLACRAAAPPPKVALLALEDNQSSAKALKPTFKFPHRTSGGPCCTVGELYQMELTHPAASPLHQDSPRGGGVGRPIGSHMSWLPARLNMVNTPTRYGVARMSTCRGRMACGKSKRKRAAWAKRLAA